MRASGCSSGSGDAHGKPLPHPSTGGGTLCGDGDAARRGSGGDLGDAAQADAGRLFRRAGGAGKAGGVRGRDQRGDADVTLKTEVPIRVSPIRVTGTVALNTFREAVREIGRASW